MHCYTSVASRTPQRLSDSPPSRKLLIPALSWCSRCAAARQRRPLLLAQSAAAAGAGGINDDNKERVVKGSVGEPSQAQPTVGAGMMHIRHQPGQMYMLEHG